MKAFLIAEIGINHNGDLDIAKKLIDMAKESKWDAVKFQKRDVKTVIPKHMWNVKKETPWGNISYLEYKNRLELSYKDFLEIDSYCRNLNIPWFASAWDLKSIEFLNKFDLKYNKIASTMLTNREFIEAVAKQQKLTFISTAMSTWNNIDYAVNLFKKYGCPFILMHCVGLYPCPINKLNLNMISTLKNRYPDVEIGYSGHLPGSMDAIIAKVLGANYIEKHITLDRSMWGSDQSASIESNGLKYIRKHCDNIDKMLGDGKRKISDDEKLIAKKMRYWE